MKLTPFVTPAVVTTALPPKSSVLCCGLDPVGTPFGDKESLAAGVVGFVGWAVGGNWFELGEENEDGFELSGSDGGENVCSAGS